jgi:hypothetical protein
MGNEFLFCMCFVVLILSLVQLVILIGIAFFLVRLGDAFTKVFIDVKTEAEPVKKKVDDKGLMDVATSQVPYNRIDERPIE